MQIALFSDTHGEFRPWIVPELPGVDVVVLAGDLGASPKHYDDTLSFMRAKNPRTEIVTVLGNHEFYRGPSLNDRGAYHAIADAHGAILLDNSEATIKGYTFVGGTLWTDVAAKFGDFEARNKLNDYNYITVRDGERLRDLSVQDISREHKMTSAMIRAVLSRPGGAEKMIVVTHHAPSYESAMQFRGDPRLNDFYCNDYVDMLHDSYHPIAWLHGHIHSVSDYMIDRTRVMCNPRGYAPNNITKTFQVFGARLTVPDLA